MISNKCHFILYKYLIPRIVQKNKLIISIVYYVVDYFNMGFVSVI